MFHHEVPGEIGKVLDGFVARFPDYVKAADTIAASGIPYTLVRAGNIVDGNKLDYQLQEEGEPATGGSVDRPAVAKFIVDIIMDKNGLGRNDSLGVVNKLEE